MLGYQIANGPTFVRISSIKLQQFLSKYSLLKGVELRFLISTTESKPVHCHKEYIIYYFTLLLAKIIEIVETSNRDQDESQFWRESRDNLLLEYFYVRLEGLTQLWALCAEFGLAREEYEQRRTFTSVQIGINDFEVKPTMRIARSLCQGWLF